MSDTAVAANGIDRNDVREFRGIRYATACRFDPPVDCRQIEMLDGGTRFGPQAPQVSGPLDQLLGAGEIESDEDCHFLNVFTPDCDDARRPVLVFVHGGAFVTGTAAMPWYDGAPLARGGDVVVVTINYRLGALGFLGDRNLGSLDQISALRWVRRFIEKFGGDPERVTVFGESAGGASVVALFAAPEAEQLLHAGWAMSPSIPQLRTAERAQMNERRFLDQLGPAASVADAREASVEDVLAAQIGDARLAASMQSFTPTHDTEVFPNDIVAAAANDTRPLVIGTTRDEMQLFAAFDPARSEWTEDHLSSEFQRRFGERADEAIAIYRRLDPEGTVSQLVSAMQTDEVFRQPSIALAEARVSQSNPTWMYLFDQTSSAFGGRMASCHGLDLPFAFDTLSARGAKMFTGSHDGLSTVAEQFSGALIAFARQREPGWPAYSLEGRQTQRIGPHPQVVDDPEADRRKLWSTGESPS